MSDERQPRLARDVATSGAGLLFYKVTGALGGIGAARLLGPSSKGTYAILVFLGTVVGTGATCGLEYWVQRQVALSGSSESVRWVIRRHERLMTAVAVIGGCLAAVFMKAGFLEPLELVALVLFVLATTLSTVRLAVSLGRRDMRRVVVANGLAGVTYLVWVGLLLALHRPSVGLVLLGAALGTFLIVPLAGVPVRAGQKPRREPGAYRGAVRFGLPASLGEVLALASYRADLVLLGAFTSSRQVGLYATAAALSELIWLAPNAVAIVLLPHVAGRPDGRDTARAVRVMVPITAIAGTGLVVLGSPILRTVFGPAFGPAAVALGPLVLAAVLLGAWKILVADLVGRGFSRYRASTALMGLCVMVASDFVLIPRFGIVGAGLGSVLGYGTAALRAALAWKATTGGSLAELVVPRREDVTALRRTPARTAWRVSAPTPVAPIGEVNG